MKRMTIYGAILVVVVAGCRRSDIQQEESLPPLGVAATYKGYEAALPEGALMSKSGGEGVSAAECGVWGSSGHTTESWVLQTPASAPELSALAGVAEQEISAELAPASGVSRSSETEFEAGDTMGVWVHTGTPLSSNNVHSGNLCYVTRDGAGWIAANALSGPITGSSWATGYTPYIKGMTDPLVVSHTVQQDQSAKPVGRPGGLELSDWVSSPATPITNPVTAPEVSLQFVHRMTKFVVSFTVPVQVDGEEIAGVESVQVLNTLLGCRVNLATGVVSSVGGAAGAIIPRAGASTTGQAGTPAQYEAVVVPQTVAKGTPMVKIMLRTKLGSTKELGYTAQSGGGDLVLAAGKKYTLTLSSTSDLAFLSELDLLDGQAKTLPLDIKVAAGQSWSLTSGSAWLTLATTETGTFGSSISGTGDGNTVTVYVRTTANTSGTGGFLPRESILTLKNTATGASAVYPAVQNYSRFEVPSNTFATPVDIPAGRSATAVATFSTNLVWQGRQATTPDPGVSFAWGAGAELWGDGTQGATYPASGSHVGPLHAGTKLYVHVDGNNTGVQRVASVTYMPQDAWGGDVTAMSKVFYYRQAAPTISLAATTGGSTSWNAPAEATIDYSVTSTTQTGLNWSVSSDQPWLTVHAQDAVNRTGSGTTRISTTLNATKSNRIGNLNINWATWDWVTYNGALKKFAVTQAAASFTPGSTMVLWNETTATVNISGTPGLSWSASKDADQSGVFGSPVPSSGTLDATGKGSFTVSITSTNPQPSPARNATYKVAVTNTGADGSLDAVVVVTQNGEATDRIVVGNLHWATGNLVATASGAVAQGTGVTIGKPEDGGLYFQFGSLIGYKGGSNGKGTGQINAETTNGKAWNGATTFSWNNDMQVYPTGLSGNPGSTWPATATTGSNQWYFSNQSVTSGVINTTNAAYGVGDPCTYYLGSPWRLPTLTEFDQLSGAGSSGGMLEGSSGYFLGPNAKNSPSIWNSVFIPSTGYRNATYAGFGSYAYYWAGSVHNGNGAYGYILAATATSYAARSTAYPVRCVQELFSVDVSSWTTPESGGAKTVAITAAMGSWTASVLRGDGPSISGGSGSGNGSFTMTYGPIAAGKGRHAVVRITNSIGATWDIYVSQGISSVKIGRLNWATGHLVATASGGTASGTGMITGTPVDMGLYFQFGSLIGYKGGSDGKGTGQVNSALNEGKAWNGATAFSFSNDAQIWPSTMSGNPGSTFPAATTSHRWFFSNTNVTTGTVNVNTPASGVGDPCTYYLGALWRLPLATDYMTIGSGTFAVVGTTKGYWFGTPNAADALFFPASGYRYSNRGTFYATGDKASYLWGGTVYDGNSGYATANASAVSSNNRQYAFSVRCVQELLKTDPTTWSVAEAGGSRNVAVTVADGASWTAAVTSGDGPMIVGGSGTGNGSFTMTYDAVAAGESRSAVVRITATNGGSTDLLVSQGTASTLIGRMRWTTGNLVATASGGVAAGTGVSVGAPTDGGLYFQFGSLIGYKGGSDGKGTGWPEMSWMGKWWNGATAFNWAYDAQVWPSALSGNPGSTWPQTTTSHWWFFSNTNVTTGEVNVNTPSSGVGDPCAYYLGSPWRLPTVGETGELGTGTPSMYAGYPGYWYGVAYSDASLFLPSSGYRTGTFYYLGSQANAWSSTVGGASYGYRLYNGSSHNTGRTEAFPVRCMQELLKVDNTSWWFNENGGSKTINVTVYPTTSTWRAEVASGGEGLTLSGGSNVTGNGSFSINYPSISSGWREADIRITSSTGAVFSVRVGQAKFQQNPPSASDYVTIGGLKCTKGNLVAVSTVQGSGGGCRVGTPADDGLFFMYGSLIGWKNGPLGDGRGALPVTWSGKWFNGATAFSFNNHAQIWPAGMSGDPGNTWPATTTGFNKWWFSNSAATTGGIPAIDIANAVGDPCTYYLGSPWRVPTLAESTALGNIYNAVGTYSGRKGGWLGGTNVATSIFLPANDVMNGNNGSYRGSGDAWVMLNNNKGSTGGMMGWSSGGSSWTPDWGSSGASYATAVRCVSK